MPPRVPPLRPNELLETLIRHDVEFVVIGGIAAVLHGSPYTTFDLDVVYDRSDRNLDRLEAALEELDAVLHDPTDRHLRPDRSLLESSGPKLLRTKFGRLDLLGELGADVEWDQVVADSVAMPLKGRDVKVLKLEKIIEIKERVGRDKDRASLPLLRATLAKRDNGSDQS